MSSRFVLSDNWDDRDDRDDRDHQRSDDRGCELDIPLREFKTIVCLFVLYMAMNSYCLDEVRIS